MVYATISVNGNS